MKQRVHQMLIFYRCGHLCNFMSSCDAIMNKYPAPRAKAGNLRVNIILVRPNPTQFLGLHDRVEQNFGISWVKPTGPESC